MRVPRRPLIAIPGRFSSSASVLRHCVVVTARTLAEAVYTAGGEPLTVLPDAQGPLDSAHIARRFGFADGVLLPGGGDLSPDSYGQTVSSTEVYGIDSEQDDMDLAIARWAFGAGVPLLAICRGMQALNVALGGTLEQHMSAPHRHMVQPLTLIAGSRLTSLLGTTHVDISCFHHQRVDHLAPVLRVVATATDGTIEAVEVADRPAFCIAVQWHPEDTAAIDPANAALFTALVEASGRPRAEAT